MNLTYVTNIPQLCPVKKVLRAVFTTAFHRRISETNSSSSAFPVPYFEVSEFSIKSFYWLTMPAPWQWGEMRDLLRHVVD